MATHKSAEKRTRQAVKRNAINRSRRTQIRSEVRSAREAIVGGDHEAAVKAARAAEAVLARAASRGTIHKNTAARKTSRLAKRLKAMTKA